MAAEDLGMTRFWIWGVRNPCVLLGAVATGAGLYGVADMSIAMTTLLFFGVLAEAANHLARRTAARQRRARALAEIATLRHREPASESYYRRAA